MNDLPAPMSPADCDLTGFAFMPLDTARLLKSDFVAISSAEAFRAAVLLWCAAWQQVPAGSLPDDDRVLAWLAGYGRDVVAWQAIKSEALHGFILCSDGRLYHPVICEKAADAWKKKTVRRKSAQAAAAKRWGKSPGAEGQKDMPGQSGGQPRKGRQKKKEPDGELFGPVPTEPIEAAAEAPSPAPAHDATGMRHASDTHPTRSTSAMPKHANREGEGEGIDPAKAGLSPDFFADKSSPEKRVYDYGKKVLGKSSGGLIKKLIDSTDDLDCAMDALKLAEPKSSPREYIGAIVRGDHNATSDITLAQTDRLYRQWGVIY